MYMHMYRIHKVFFVAAAAAQYYCFKWNYFVSLCALHSIRRIHAFNEEKRAHESIISLQFANERICTWDLRRIEFDDDEYNMSLYSDSRGKKSVVKKFHWKWIMWMCFVHCARDFYIIYFFLPQDFSFFYRGLRIYNAKHDLFKIFLGTFLANQLSTEIHIVLFLFHHNAD